jgi:hypothetical protein
MKVECGTYGRDEEAIHFDRAPYEDYFLLKDLVMHVSIILKRI